MAADTETTMSPVDLLAVIDDCASKLDFHYRDTRFGKEMRTAFAAVAALIERNAELQAEHAEDQSVIAVWRGRCERAESERDALAAALQDFVHCSDSHQSLSRAANELLARAEARNV